TRPVPTDSGHRGHEPPVVDGGPYHGSGTRSPGGPQWDPPRQVAGRGRRGARPFSLRSRAEGTRSQHVTSGGSEERVRRMRQFVAFIAAVLVTALAGPAGAQPFADTPATHWAYDAIAELAAKGLIEGYPDG